MFRYLIVTRVESRTLITSPLLPEGTFSGGAFRATVDLRSFGAGPFAPHVPAGMPTGGSPVMTMLNSPSSMTGSPVQIPWMEIVLVGAAEVLLVCATTATAGARLQGWPSDASQKG